MQKKAKECSVYHTQSTMRLQLNLFDSHDFDRLCFYCSAIPQCQRPKSSSRVARTKLPYLTSITTMISHHCAFLEPIIIPIAAPLVKHEKKHESRTGEEAKYYIHNYHPVESIRVTFIHDNAPACLTAT